MRRLRPSFPALVRVCAWAWAAEALVVTRPANIAGVLFHSPSAIGPALPEGLRGEVLWPDPQNGCSAPSNSDYTRGQIVLGRMLTVLLVAIGAI